MSSLTPLQKATVQAIVNVFETSRVLGDYSSVTLLNGDPGHLTYGRSQTTLASGNLHLLIKAYCEAENADFADDFRPYLTRLKNKDLTLDHDTTFRRLLREAGREQTMRDEQDAFFDRVYFNPAVTLASAASIATPLGIAVVYDSKVQGSWGKIRDKTTLKLGGNAKAVGEKKWVTTYVDIRRDWLATHPTIPILHSTVYRMDSFKKLIAAKNWDLTLPLRAHGILINKDNLGLVKTVVASADDDELPVLSLTQPFTTGEAVRRVQKALGITEDGTFGKATETAVKEYQKKNGLKPDGIVGSATYASLGIS